MGWVHRQVGRRSLALCKRRAGLPNHTGLSVCRSCATHRDKAGLCNPAASPLRLPSRGRMTRSWRAPTSFRSHQIQAAVEGHTAEPTMSECSCLSQHSNYRCRRLPHADSRLLSKRCAVLLAARRLPNMPECVRTHLIKQQGACMQAATPAAAARRRGRRPLPSPAGCATPSSQPSAVVARHS